jgi:hypothetical protein
MIGPFPRDDFLEKTNRPIRTWNVWFNKLKDQANFGEPPSANIDITATIGIQLTSDLMRIQSATAGAITVTVNPQISKGHDGQKIILEGLNNTKTVTITTGNGLILAGGASFIIGLNDIIGLIYNEAKNLWLEMYRSNN